MVCVDSHVFILRDKPRYVRLRGVDTICVVQDIIYKLKQVILYHIC